MGDNRAWKHVDVPFESTLRDVVQTKERVYAVGDSGALLRRKGGAWTTLLDSGPSGNSNDLCCVGTTANGKRVWYAGTSGVVGCLEVGPGRLKDFSNPEEQSDQWTDMVVSGKAGSEVVRVADDNGEIVTLDVSKFSVESTSLVEPKSAGQSITGLARGEQGTVYAVNTSGKLFSSPDGQNWSATELADTDFADVATSDGVVYAITSSGTGYTYDPNAGTTGTFETGIGVTYAVTAGDRVAVSGTSGKVADHTGSGWQSVETPASNDLYGVSVSASDFAVGASGTVVERTR